MATLLGLEPPGVTPPAEAAATEGEGAVSSNVFLGAGESLTLGSGGGDTGAGGLPVEIWAPLLWQQVSPWLPEVVEALEPGVEVLVDGGVRRGVDVAKALALGARAVLIGRPYLWGLAVSGEDGVRDVLELLREETRLALALAGCTSPGEVTRSHVQRAGR